MTGPITFSGRCRNCDREVVVSFPLEERYIEGNSVRAFCGQCGTTVYATK